MDMPSSQNESPQENVSRRGLLFGWLKKTTPEGYQEEPKAQNAESPIQEKKRITRREANALLGGGALAAGLALTTGCGSKGFDYREPEVVKKGEEPSREEMLKGKPDFVPSKTWLGWDSTTRNAYRTSQGIAYQEGKVNKQGDPIGTARLETNKVEDIEENEASWITAASRWHFFTESLGWLIEHINKVMSFDREMHFGNAPAANPGDQTIGEASLSLLRGQRYDRIDLSHLTVNQLRALSNEVGGTEMRLRDLQRNIRSRYLTARAIIHGADALIFDIYSIGRDLGFLGGKSINLELKRGVGAVADIGAAYIVNKVRRTIGQETYILEESESTLAKLKLRIESEITNATERERRAAEQLGTTTSDAEEKKKKDEKREERKEELEHELKKQQMAYEFELKKRELDLKNRPPIVWTPDQGTPPK